MSENGEMGEGSGFRVGKLESGASVGLYRSHSSRRGPREKSRFSSTFSEVRISQFIIRVDHPRFFGVAHTKSCISHGAVYAQAG